MRGGSFASRLASRLALAGAAMALVACDGIPGFGERSSDVRTVAESRRQLLAKRVHDVGTSAGDAPVARWKLPEWLSEVSGLTLLPNGLVVAHGDERGRLALIDPRTGIVRAHFELGIGDVAGDFEGITLVGDSLYMLESDAKVFVFPVGKDGTGVPFRVVDTGLGKACEFESIVNDADDRALLMACKRVHKESDKGRLVVYRLALPLGRAPQASRFELPLPDDEKGKKGTFEASDLTRDPFTGDFVALASREREILAFTREGELLASASLPEGKKHAQPEGIAITRDSLLLVTDEAVDGPALLTVYRWPLSTWRREAP